MENILPAKPAERLTFIDHLRGIAVIWMIETHVFNAFLSDSLRKSFAWDLLNISNGFVAVAFLFCAGAGFYINAERKIDKFLNFDPELWLYVRRLLFILTIAYWIHLPSFSLVAMYNMTADQFLKFSECDILQNIVLTSFFSLFLIFATPKKRLAEIALGVTILLFFIGPAVWRMDPFSTFPVFFATWFAEPPVSKFPLIPWSGFFLMGIAISGFFSRAKDKVKFSKNLAATTFILPLVLLFTKNFYYTTGPGNDWWLGSTGHSFFRISVVACMFATLFLLQKYLKPTIAGKYLEMAGKESLFLYVSHLFIVYGSVHNMSAKTYIGSQFGYLGCTVITIVITAACSLLAWYWSNTKRNRKNTARIIIRTVTIGLAAIFLLNF